MKSRKVLLQSLFDDIKKFFNGDAEKTWKWFKTRNPSLGGVSPLKMIQLGREKKLKDFIDSRLRGNWP